MRNPCCELILFMCQNGMAVFDGRVTSKSWTTQDGRVHEGKLIDKTLVYALLHNRTYLGELRHKDQWYPAEHLPIVEQDCWDKAHAILSTNSRVRGNNTRSKVPFHAQGHGFRQRWAGLVTVAHGQEKQRPAVSLLHSPARCQGTYRAAVHAIPKPLI